MALDGRAVREVVQAVVVLMPQTLTSPEALAATAGIVPVHMRYSRQLQVAPLEPQVEAMVEAQARLQTQSMEWAVVVVVVTTLGLVVREATAAITVAAVVVAADA